MRSPGALAAEVNRCACAHPRDPVRLPLVRIIVLLVALLAVACKKELGDLCDDSSECESEVCYAVSPLGASHKKICVTSPPCPTDAKDIGECFRVCSAGCFEGTVCHPGFQVCVAPCDGEGQCRNNTYNLITGICE